MTPEQEIDRGRSAKRILDDSVYQESWDAVMAKLNDLLNQVDIDPEKEKRVLFTKKGLALARKHLETVMQTGKMAAETIERDRTFAQRVRDKVYGS